MNRPDRITRLDAGPAEGTVGYRLRLAQILAFRAFEQRLTDYGRAPRYLGLLSVIRAHPGQLQSRLAETVALQRSSLVTILDQLAADGMIERRTSKTDRRANGVWLTERGERIVAELMEEAHAHDTAMTEGLTEAETRTLRDLLGRVIDNLSE